MIYQSVSVVSQRGAGAWLNELASREQRRLTGSGSALESVFAMMHYTNGRVCFFYFTFYSGKYAKIDKIDLPVSEYKKYATKVMCRSEECNCRVSQRNETNCNRVQNVCVSTCMCLYMFVTSSIKASGCCVHQQYGEFNDVVMDTVGHC